MKEGKVNRSKQRTQPKSNTYSDLQPIGHAFPSRGHQDAMGLLKSRLVPLSPAAPFSGLEKDHINPI